MAWRNPTVPWDHGMGWTVGHTCICRWTWTSHGMSHCPMGLWDGMDNLWHFWTSISMHITHRLKQEQEQLQSAHITQETTHTN